MKALPDAMKPREKGLAKTKPNETRTPSMLFNTIWLCGEPSFI
jgi:hypothetical protein